jgi:hypothetical protein
VYLVGERRVDEFQTGSGVGGAPSGSGDAMGGRAKLAEKWYRRISISG